MRLFINGHNVRLGWVVVSLETGEPVRHYDRRLSWVRRLVDRFNRRHVPPHMQAVPPEFRQIVTETADILAKAAR